MYNNYTDGEKYQSCTVIIPSSEVGGALLIGDFNSATDANLIKKYNIKTIITAAVGMEHLEVPDNIIHITYALLDAKSENIRKFFDQSSSAIKTNLKRGSVLVHCAAGISRSTTLVLAYLMKSYNIGFKQALSLARSKRKKVCPNLGFELQLKKYERELKGGYVKQNFMKKKETERIPPEEFRTSFNSNQHENQSNNVNLYLKFQPKTAEESVRRRNEAGRRAMIIKPRERKNFQVRTLNKNNFMILGSNKQQNPSTEKVNPPIIQSYNPSAINNNWDKPKRFRIGC